ncbi:MAG: hypothetical protein DRO14_06095 [Thermoprotei archaeon]|nr:MAG: hypothetical protein DRO14_06095 [Thermoprotei archaeon]
MGEEVGEEFEVGRRVGVVARRNRELYESVKLVAKQKGLTMSEVLEEALELWRIYQTFEDVSPKALVAAIHFVEHMLNRAVELLVKLGAVFTSEFFKTNIDVLQSIATHRTTQQTHASQQQQTQVPQAQGFRPSPIEAIKEQVRATVMQSMIPVLMGTVQQLLATVGKTSGAEIPQMQLPVTTPQTTTRTVKVEE